MKKFFTTLLALLCAGSAFAFGDGGYNEGDARVQGSLTIDDPDAEYGVLVDSGYVKLGDGWLQYNTGTSELQFSNNAGIDWTAIGSGGVGGGSTVKVDGVTKSTADFIDSADINVTASGSSVTMALSSAVASNVGLGVTAYSYGNHNTAGYLKTVALDDLTDVSTTGQADGMVLGYNGSAWVPTTPAVASHNDLRGLQGGSAGNYYHQTATEYAGTFGHGASFAGNVGIGTTAPTAALSVTGSGILSDALTVVGDMDVGSGDLFVGATAGNVGIGTTNPIRKLDVAGTGRFTGALSSSSTISASSSISTTSGSIYSSDTTNGIVFGRNAAGTGNIDTTFYFSTAANLGSYIRYNTNSATTTHYGGSALSLGTYQNANSVYMTGGNVAIGTSTTTLKFAVNGSAYVSGNVGIGTATPAQKLAINGSCIQLKSPDGTLSNCCVSDADAFTCTGV